MISVIFSVSPAQAAILRVIHDHHAKSQFITQTRVMQLAGVKRREFEKNIGTLQKAGVVRVETYRRIKIIAPIESIVVEEIQQQAQEENKDVAV